MNTKHTRWDGAIITAGGFHANDCPCDGCKALAKIKPIALPNLLRDAEESYFTLREAALKLQQQRDELLAACKDTLADYIATGQISATALRAAIAQAEGRAE